MLITAYCTVAEADVIIGEVSEWEALEDQDKETALSWGRVYIDSTYNCLSAPSSTSDEYDNYQNAIKTADALLGLEYVNGTLFSTSNYDTRSVVEKSAQAGSVKVSKKFAASTSDAYLDPYFKITALLAPYCSKSSKTFSTAYVVR